MRFNYESNPAFEDEYAREGGRLAFRNDLESGKEKKKMLTRYIQPILFAVITIGSARLFGIELSAFYDKTPVPIYIGLIAFVIYVLKKE